MANNSTVLENALLANIINSEYQDGGDPVGHDVWSSGDFLTGGKITASNIAGVMASLVKKGFVEVSQYSRTETTVALTAKGMEAYQNPGLKV